jgi:small-conductance mechanosensitive channel
VIELFELVLLMTPWIIIPAVILGAVALAFLINIIALRVLGRLVHKTSNEGADRLYRLVKRYLFPLLALSLLLLFVSFTPLPAGVLQLANRVFIISALVLTLFLVTQAGLIVLRNMESRYEAVRDIKGPLEAIVKIILIAVGGTIVLDNLGISLTPLITTLGIGSLAVAIALQDTLGNFFAGLYIKADHPIKVGHYIRLENGQEGYVERVGWRSTHFRALQNNIIIVPNSKLAQLIVTNYYLPDRESAVLVEAGVGYDAELSEVERITCEVAKEVLKTVPGSVPGFEPFIRYRGFNQSNIDFTVTLRAREFVDNFLIRHEFIKRLHTRFQAEGISFTTNTVYLKEPDRNENRFGNKVRRMRAKKTSGLNAPDSSSPSNAN